MDASKMKNMIVIKNLPSNIIDEAFIVLKSNKKMKAFERIEKEREKNIQGKNNYQNYITKEAEMVLSNYLSDIENSKTKKTQNIKQLEKKYKKLKKLTIMLGILLLLSIIIWTIENDWGRGCDNQFGTDFNKVCPFLVHTTPSPINN